jgi:hypothetical protein
MPSVAECGAGGLGCNPCNAATADNCSSGGTCQCGSGPPCAGCSGGMCPDLDAGDDGGD